MKCKGENYVLSFQVLSLLEHFRPANKCCLSVCVNNLTDCKRLLSHWRTLGATLANSWGLINSGFQIGRWVDKYGGERQYNIRDQWHQIDRRHAQGLGKVHFIFLQYHLAGRLGKIIAISIWSGHRSMVMDEKRNEMMGENPRKTSFRTLAQVARTMQQSPVEKQHSARFVKS